MLIAFDGVNLKGWVGHVDVDGFNRKRMHLTEMNEVVRSKNDLVDHFNDCLLYTSPSPRDQRGSRMPSSA